MINKLKFLLNQPTYLNHHCTLSIMSMFPAISMFPSVTPISNVSNPLSLFLAMVENGEWLKTWMGAPTM